MSSEESNAIYFISVASTLSGIHQQTLRTYEEKGLIKPFRTGGGTRRYSQEDIDKLIQIQNLSQRQNFSTSETNRQPKACFFSRWSTACFFRVQRAALQCGTHL